MYCIHSRIHTLVKIRAFTIICMHVFMGSYSERLWNVTFLSISSSGSICVSVYMPQLMYVHTSTGSSLFYARLIFQLRESMDEIEMVTRSQTARASIHVAMLTCTFTLTFTRYVHIPTPTSKIQVYVHCR